MKSLRISFVVPVLNETTSLRDTVDVIHAVAGLDLCEIVIVIAKTTTSESLAVVDELGQRYPRHVRIHRQQLPFLGGAIQEAFARAKGDHVMLMSSDLETDPMIIPAFINKIREGGWDIVAASRWLKGGGFEGYDPLKLFLNFLFQQCFRLLYFTRLTDLTYAYRLYKKESLDNIVWNELKHPFLLECLVKPLRLGARATEIPCRWRARLEGPSANTLLQTFAYVRTAFVVRFTPLHRLKRER